MSDRMTGWLDDWILTIPILLASTCGHSLAKQADTKAKWVQRPQAVTKVGIGRGGGVEREWRKQGKIENVGKLEKQLFSSHAKWFNAEL